MSNEIPGENHRTGVQHHYIFGLRFDTMWSYPIRLRNARKDWIRLNLTAGADLDGVKVDPEGARWCVRCCASVLGQRPVPLTDLYKRFTAEGDGAQVAAALAMLLPGFAVRMQTGLNRAQLNDTTRLIQAGGSMLVRLERVCAKRQTLPCWMWVVGVELRTAAHGVPSVQGPKEAADAPALLLVGRELGPSWASGYGAKAIWVEDGIWSVRSVDAQTWQGAVTCTVRICPR